MTSLYIHIPFCKQKCNYCDFVSYSDKEDLIDSYVDNLINEIHSLDLGPRISDLATIYFGGGTPTLLGLKHYEKVLFLLKMKFIFNKNAELTIEANPGTAGAAKLKNIRHLGINRLSIGAQSFNNQHLKTLGRIHNSNDIFRKYEDARAAGFENINLDLIFALPNQTLEEWKKDLNTALSLQPEHLSTYNLQVEENTPLWEMTNDKCFDRLSMPSYVEALKMSNDGKTILNIPLEETELAMYEYAIETLTNAGYIHYEISNFAKPGFSCRHNINYWKNGNYVGIGAGAHSHINGKRWANPDSIEEYVNSVMVMKPVSSNGHRASIRVSGSVTDQRDSLFMGLRLLQGLPAEKFQGFETELNKLIESGLLTKENSQVKLTRKGLYLANEVFEKFV